MIIGITWANSACAFQIVYSPPLLDRSPPLVSCTARSYCVLMHKEHGHRRSAKNKDIISSFGANRQESIPHKVIVVGKTKRQSNRKRCHQ